MMKEWTVARQRVQEMRLFDEKGAEKLNRQITAVSIITTCPVTAWAEFGFSSWGG